MVSGSSIVIHPPPGCARAPARTALTPPSYGRRGSHANVRVRALCRRDPKTALISAGENRERPQLASVQPQPALPVFAARFTSSGTRRPARGPALTAFHRPPRGSTGYSSRGPALLEERPRP